VKLALVKNPKVPLAVTMKLLLQLQETDIKSLSKDKNVPGAVAQQAKRMLDKKVKKE
jgi:hypothetical protein